MDIESIKDLESDQLVTQAGSPESRVRDQSQAELTRRLMESIRSFDKSAKGYSKGLLFLTVALLGLGLLQLAAALLGPPKNMWIGLLVLFLFGCFLVIFMWKVSKELDKLD